MVWKPNVTVAAVIEQESQLLFVRESAQDQVVLNQPAGHLEKGESLTDAIQREVLEETGWDFKPEYLIGIYLLDQRDTTYLRFCFGGKLGRQISSELDEGIIETVWLPPEELPEHANIFRSELVDQCIQDYFKGTRYPLSILSRYP